MLLCICFPVTEDSATLRSDMSAVPGFPKAVIEALPFLLPSRKLKAINLGVRGSAPGTKIFRFPLFKRIYYGLKEFVILSRRQLFKFSLVTVIVVIVHPVIYDSNYLFICFALLYQVRDFVFHMAEEAFLRRIVPAVSFARH